MKKLKIFYDNWCPNCSSFSHFVKQLDWLHLIELEALRNDGVELRYPSIDYDLAKKQMAAFDSKWHYGFDSLYLIFIRLPLFWLFIPFLFLLKISQLGQFIYLQFAVNRKIIPLHCDENSCKL